MRLRTGTALAFGVGYVLGTRAGRERYQQIVRAFVELGRSAPVSSTAGLVASKSRAAANLGVERLKDTIGVRLGWRNGDQAADALAAEMAEDLATALNHRRHREQVVNQTPRHHRRRPPAVGRAVGQASSR